MPDLEIPTFNIAVTGYSGCGKRQLINTLATGHFETRYYALMEPEEKTLLFDTTHGPVRFRVMIMSQHFLGIYERSIVRSLNLPFAGAIVLFDFSSRLTYKSVPLFFRRLKGIRGNYLQSIGVELTENDSYPVAICGNKCENIGSRKISKSSIKYPAKQNAFYCDMSVKARYNIYDPFEYLARQFMHAEDLRILNHPDYALPVTMPVEIATYDLPLQSKDTDIGTTQNEEERERLEITGQMCKWEAEFDETIS